MRDCRKRPRMLLLYLEAHWRGRSAPQQAGSSWPRLRACGPLCWQCGGHDERQREGFGMQGKPCGVEKFTGKGRPIFFFFRTLRDRPNPSRPKLIRLLLRSREPHQQHRPSRGHRTAHHWVSKERLFEFVGVTFTLDFDWHGNIGQGLRILLALLI